MTTPSPTVPAVGVLPSPQSMVAALASPVKVATATLPESIPSVALTATGVALIGPGPTAAVLVAVAVAPPASVIVTVTLNVP